MAARPLPTGTVTFMFSDIEGSTRLLQELGEGYIELLGAHRDIVRRRIREGEGSEISTEGDSFFVVFPSAPAAIQTAADIQRSLAEHPSTQPLRVRMGLHTGEGRVAGDDYVGMDVHRAARIAAAAHGGQVLVSDATRAVAGSSLPAELTLRDLGLHRLKDLAQPERLFQLLVKGLPSEFPPPRSLDARPNNLPVALNRFIGREDQVSDLKARLLDGARLLTLTGPGGTGKTRLALEVAGEVLTAFDDGAWFVDLAPIADPALVVSVIAETLGVKQQAGRQVPDELEAALKDASMLVVLDNFEQVVQAGETVERLLRAAPRLKVLVTSRAVLHRYGEQEFPVPPFDLPDPRKLVDPASLGGYESIALFVERATAVRPDFVLDEDNAAAVAEIAVRLDGLPLAIELAASRAKILSPQAILERLRAGFPVLVSRVADAPERQRTLRGAIEWSYDLLDEDERRLFQQLSVFQAGASLEAAEAVCPSVPGGDVLEGLTSLVDHSLLRQVGAEGGQPRFGMLETIKEYAGERLHDEPEHAAAVHRAHATYFADFAERVREQLAGPRREAAMAAMAADIENLRVSWRYWVAEKDLQYLNKLVDSLWLLYDARGWVHATVELTTDLLGVLSSTPSTPDLLMQEVMLRTSLARGLLAIHGYTEEVERAYVRALELSAQHPELPQAFPVLRGLASYYMSRAELDKEIEVGRDILRLADAQHDPTIELAGHLVMGRCSAFTGDLHGGLAHLDRAIALFESQGAAPGRFQLGPNPGVAALTTSALVLWMLGHPDRALERADRAVSLALGLGHPYTIAFALFHSGFLHWWRREPELVSARGQGVREIGDEHDLPVWSALGVCLLGAAEVGMGRPEEGLAQLRQGLELYRGLTTPPVFWPLLLYVHAWACGRAGLSAEGSSQVDGALEVAWTGHASRNPVLPELFMMKGDLLLAGSEPAGAESWFQRAFDMAAELDARMPQLRAALRLCRLSADRDEADAGARTLRPVYEWFTEGFDTLDLIEAGGLLNGPRARLT
jgi:predicted ATPase/class 3 adenylate cyclase